MLPRWRTLWWVMLAVSPALGSLLSLCSPSDGADEKEVRESREEKERLEERRLRDASRDYEGLDLAIRYARQRLAVLDAQVIASFSGVPLSGATQLVPLSVSASQQKERKDLLFRIDENERLRSNLRDRLRGTRFEKELGLIQ